MSAAAPLAPLAGGTIFTPDKGYVEATGPRYAFCPAALSPDSYAKPGDQIFEGDTGWFFQQLEINWDASIAPDLYADVHRIAQTLAKRGTKLIVVVPPPRAILAYDHLPRSGGGFNPALEQRALLLNYLSMADHMRDSGAILPDILGEARRQKLSFDRYTNPADLHWSSTGAWLTALAVTRSIAPDRLKSGVPPVQGTFTSVTNNSSYPAILNRLCKTKKPKPLISAFTALEDNSLSGDTLLGESKSPDIVMVGTSFSDPSEPYGFGSFLQALSGRDVLNLSITGGGPLTAITQYVGSDEFKTARPKYLVWEFTSSNLPGESSASERAGLLRAACPASYRTIKTSFRPSVSPIATSADIAGASVEDRPVQLMLHSDNAAFKNFAVVLNYVDGRQKSINVDTRRATLMNPDYTLVLPPDHALISDISVNNVEPLIGQITAQVCPAVDAGAPATSSPTLFSRVAAWFKSFWS